MVQFLTQCWLLLLLRVHFNHTFANCYILSQIHTSQIDLLDVLDLPVLVPNLETIKILQLVPSHFLQSFEARIGEIAFFRRERILQILYWVYFRSDRTILYLDRWFELQSYKDLSVLVYAAISQRCSLL